MGKRSNFERIDKDRYLTPIDAVRPLIPHLPERDFTFAEPCAWDGRLAAHVETLTQGRGQWRFMSDIEPGHHSVKELDALTLRESDVASSEFIITNPPWSRELLMPMIERFRLLRPTWLLFDADWMHTVQDKVAKKKGCPLASEQLAYCHRIVSVGRVKWFPGSKSVGKENVAWYFFRKERANRTEFVPRAA